MSIINALPSAASEKRAGTRRLSAVTGNVATSESIQMDGEVVTDDSGNPIAFTNTPGTDNNVSVEVGANPDELDVTHAAGAAIDVTVTAVVE